MNRIFVTSFSEKGYEQYGRRFLDGFIQFFPPREVLHVFHEGPMYGFDHPRIILHNLMEDTDLVAFLSRNRGIPERNGIRRGERREEYIDYRWQATKFVRKVMALTSPLLPQEGYRIWIDADVTVDRQIPDDFFDQFCDPQYIAQYIGRPTAWHTSECGFVAYNLGFNMIDGTHRRGAMFLDELRNEYVSDDVFALNEWHDSYVFDYFRQRTRGKFKNIAEGHDIFHPWPETVLGEYMTHHKGPVAKREIVVPVTAAVKLGDPVTHLPAETKTAESVPPDWSLPEDKICSPLPKMAAMDGSTKPNAEAKPINIIEVLKKCENRYEQLIKIIEIYKPVSIVEVGTWNGSRAMDMVAEAMRHKPQVFYIGFDLFEDMTDELDDEESNSKSRESLDSVTTKLTNFATLNPGFTFKLIKGNTRETLPAYIKGLPAGGKIDFAFIDGGHSIETMRSDYACLKGVARLILMDDYYTAGMDTEKFGCNTLIKGENHAILPVGDMYSNGVHINMVLLGDMVGKPSAVDKKINIKTKNSATDDEIQSHIRYAATLTRERLQETLKKALTTVPVKFLDIPCKPHDDTVVLIGASEELMDKEDPDYQTTWDEIRKLATLDQYRLVICKTSYRRCFEEGVVPWGCILLDPRDHVAERIDPHPDVIYFVSSMCHPSTWDKLTESGVRVIGYHATVAAGEKEVIEKEFGKGLCISGGTTSVLRGISVFYHLGFRHAVIYGATSSYKVGPDGKSKLAKPHGRSEKPFVNVEVHGKKFVTDPEMIAQSQDSEMAVKLFPDMQLDFKGDGMLNHAVSVIRGFERDKVGEQSFTDVRIGQWVNAFRTGDLELEAINIANANKALLDRKNFLRETLAGLPNYHELIGWDQFDKLVGQ